VNTWNIYLNCGKKYEDVIDHQLVFTYYAKYAMGILQSNTFRCCIFFLFFPKELELLGLLYGLFQQFISFDQRLVKRWFVYSALIVVNLWSSICVKWTFDLSPWFCVTITYQVSTYNCNKGSGRVSRGAADRNFGFLKELLHCLRFLKSWASIFTCILNHLCSFMIYNYLFGVFLR